MKKAIIVMLVIMILISVIPTISALDVLESDEISMDGSDTIKIEEKIVTTIDINDRFKEDEIIVVLNNTTSKLLNEYSVKDFPELSINSVKNLTKESDDMIKIQRLSKSLTTNSSHSISTADESAVYINEDNHHQFLLLKLNKSGKENVIRGIKLLEQRDDVILAMPNYIQVFKPQEDSIATLDEIANLSRATTKVPDDYTHLIGQWGIDRIDLPEAWNITTGSSTVIVGVMDSGIRSDHEDLSANIAASSYHKNFINDGTSALSDQGGHGTKVAGVIAAVGNNDIGTVGACWNIKLASLKVFHYNSATDDYETTYDAFIDAVTHAKTKGIDIINYSASGGDKKIEEELNALLDYKGLFICSAGNEGIEVTGSNNYPLSYNTDNMIVVANSSENSNDALTSDSNYSATFVDLSAPGDMILTTGKNSTSDYVRASGTSMAAPYVTGVAALLKSKYPEMQTRTIKYYIVNRGVDIIPELEGKVATSGRLNAYKALNSVTTYTVTYNAGGGGGSSMANTKVIYNNYTPLRKNTYIRSGYTFVGWHAKRDSDDKWYYTNGQNSQWFLEGQQPSGYSKYLYTDEKVVFNTTSANSDIVTMTAQWSPNYTITFKGNSPTSGTMSPINRVYGVEYNLPANTFSKTNFYFQHWYAKDSNGKMYYSGSGGAGWYTPGLQPDGYTRVDFSDKMKITASTLTGITPNMTITMNAYWKPMTGILGDANVDDVVSVKDASYIEKYISGLVSMSDHQKRISDVDFSGTITVKDVTLVQKYVAGNIDEFGA